MTARYFHLLLGTQKVFLYINDTNNASTSGKYIYGWLCKSFTLIK